MFGEGGGAAYYDTRWELQPGFLLLIRNKINITPPDTGAPFGSYRLYRRENVGYANDEIWLVETSGIVDRNGWNIWLDIIYDSG